MSSSPEWFVRWQGKVQGPVTWEALQKAAHDGKLRPDMEVSQDQSSWRRADSVADLLPPPADAPAGAAASARNLAGKIGGFFRKRVEDARQEIAARGGVREIARKTAAKVDAFANDVSRSIDHALHEAEWSSIARVLRLRPGMPLDQVTARFGPAARAEVDPQGEGVSSWGRAEGASLDVEVRDGQVLALVAKRLRYDLGSPAEVPDDIAFGDFSRHHDGMTPFEALQLFGAPTEASLSASGRRSDGAGWATVDISWRWGTRQHPAESPEVQAAVAEGQTEAQVVQALGLPESVRCLLTELPGGAEERQVILSWGDAPRALSVELQSGVVCRVKGGGASR